MPPLTILVAEDYAPFREYACRQLQRRPEFRVVAVSDGLAAVEKAGDIQPDLVVLDIGLPSVDGLAAARRIRSLSPSSRIVFLTQESSPVVIHEALGLGSQGYILKTCAQHILSTVEAVLDGGRAIDGSVQAEGHHWVQFYSNDATLLDMSEQFLASALNAHDAVIAIATESHLRQLLPRLRRGNGSVDRAMERGAFLHLDANELTARILSEDVARWQPPLVRMLESAAAATARPRPRVAVFSECASILETTGHADAADDLEQRPLEIAGAGSVDILCTYPLPTAHDRRFKDVCAHHGAIAIR